MCFQNNKLTGKAGLSILPYSPKLTNENIRKTKQEYEHFNEKEEGSDKFLS